MRCKKIFCITLMILSFCVNHVYAEPRTIDLSQMTVDELDQLANEIKAEKESATKIASTDEKRLKNDFKEFLCSFLPDSADVSYPFFGLDAQRERSFYCISGDCSAKLEDKSKIKLDGASAIYWYNNEDADFHRVAFYTKETVYYVNDAILGEVAPYIEEPLLERLTTEAVQSQNEGVGEMAVEKIVTDEEKFAAILAEPDMGYDLAFMNRSATYMYVYELVDFDRNIVTQLFVHYHRGSGDYSNTDHITTTAISGNLKDGWQTEYANIDSHLYYQYESGDSVGRIIEYNYKHEKCDEYVEVEPAEAIYYLMDGLSKEAKYALRSLTPQE